jgi:molybdate-binding protein
VPGGNSPQPRKDSCQVAAVPPAKPTPGSASAPPTALGLGFVPVIWEDFDIVLSGDALPAAGPLIAALRDPAVQSSIGALGGYDLTRAGSVEMLA